MNQEQKIEALTEADLDYIVQQLAQASSLAEKIAGRPLDSSRRDLATIQQILNSKAIEHESKNTLHSLDMAFGMIFIATYSGYDWWIVKDEHGHKAAIRFGETTLLAFPQSIISKSLENGEKIHVEDLFENFRKEMDNLGRQQGLNMGNVRVIPQLADRGERLAACFIDGLIMGALCLPLVIYTGAFDFIKLKQEVPTLLQIVFFLQSVVIFLLLHGYLLYKYGQTIGKHVMKIAITDPEGRIANVWNVIALRYAAFWVFAYIPFLGGLVGMLNPLFIFRKDRRCLHDHLAGTIVIKCSW